MRKYTILFIMILVISGCRNNVPDVSDINIPDIHIKRYDQDLFRLDPESIGSGLEQLSDDYYLFIGDYYRDTLNIIQIYQYITDPLLIELHDKTQVVFPSLDLLEEKLTGAFKFYAYYFPGRTIPEIFTYISGVDAEYPVIVMDSALVIGLDCFLGSDYRVYRQMRIPVYRTRRMQPEYVRIAVMEALARNEFTPYRIGDRLIDQIIEEGKILVFLDKVFPDVPDTMKIGYTAGQLDWCENNEANIWAFLIENEMLFSSDLQKINKITQDGPFTSYFSHDSPGKIGSWVGWQIVRSYMDHNNVSLEEMMNLHDNQDILNNSGYKP